MDLALRKPHDVFEPVALPLDVDRLADLQSRHMNSEPRMHPNGYLYRFARGLLTTVIAAVPLLFVVAVHYRSKLDDWSRNDVFGYFVLCAVVLAGLWAWQPMT